MLCDVRLFPVQMDKQTNRNLVLYSLLILRKSNNMLLTGGLSWTILSLLFTSFGALFSLSE